MLYKYVEVSLAHEVQLYTLYTLYMKNRESFQKRQNEENY